MQMKSVLHKWRGFVKARSRGLLRRGGSAEIRCEAPHKTMKSSLFSQRFPHFLGFVALQSEGSRPKVVAMSFWDDGLEGSEAIL